MVSITIDTWVDQKSGTNHRVFVGGGGGYIPSPLDLKPPPIIDSLANQICSQELCNSVRISWLTAFSHWFHQVALPGLSLYYLQRILSLQIIMTGSVASFLDMPSACKVNISQYCWRLFLCFLRCCLCKKMQRKMTLNKYQVVSGVLLAMRLVN